MAWLTTYNGYETRKITYFLMCFIWSLFAKQRPKIVGAWVTGAVKLFCQRAPNRKRTPSFSSLYFWPAFITVVLRTCFSQIIPVDMFAKTLEKNHCSTISWFVVPATQIKIRFESINSIVGQVSNTCPRKYSLERLWDSTEGFLEHFLRQNEKRKEKKTAIGCVQESITRLLVCQYSNLIALEILSRNRKSTRRTGTSRILSNFKKL